MMTSANTYVSDDLGQLSADEKGFDCGRIFANLFHSTYSTACIFSSLVLFVCRHCAGALRRGRLGLSSVLPVDLFHNKLETNTQI